MALWSPMASASSSKTLHPTPLNCGLAMPPPATYATYPAYVSTPFLDIRSNGLAAAANSSSNSCPLIRDYRRPTLPAPLVRIFKKPSAAKARAAPMKLATPLPAFTMIPYSPTTAPPNWRYLILEPASYVPLEFPPCTTASKVLLTAYMY